MAFIERGPQRAERFETGLSEARRGNTCTFGRQGSPLLSYRTQSDFLENEGGAGYLDD